MKQKQHLLILILSNNIVGVTLKAPSGKFRIVCIDKFHPPGEDDFVRGDYNTLEDALNLARQWTQEASKLATDPSIATVFYVYDDKGVYRGGDIYKNE